MRPVLPNVCVHVMFHPRPSPCSMCPSPAQLNARNKSCNVEGLGPRLHDVYMYTSEPEDVSLYRCIMFYAMLFSLIN